MIVVRDIFQIIPDGMKEVRTLAKEGANLMRQSGLPVSRVMTDLVGNYYTLVLETEYQTLGEYETSLKDSLNNNDFQKWYPPVRKWIKGGNREIYSTIE